MTTPHLGRLTTVPPREVWLHEARNFTPWLLQNVDVLGSLLRMDLTLDRAEQPVGDFSLDLLGRDLADGSVVIVENQLEPSDHTHLGQILTYAAGTDPRTIVWITTGFRPEHRAALDWLNEHTLPDTRFFGIEIEVVKIGTSEPAPNFRLVAQPNDWEKHVKAATSGGPFTEEAKLYQQFWKQLRARVAAEHPEWNAVGGTRTSAWSDVPSGITGCPLTSRFMRDGLLLQLTLHDQTRYDALYAKRAEFEAQLGQKAQWDDKPGQNGARIYITSPYRQVGDTDQWNAMLDWLMDHHVRFRAAIAAVDK
ncbi:DUF4268 domain-containing protein [Mycolicibacterium sp. HS_4_1]